jgi:hypothetical protein
MPPLPIPLTNASNNALTTMNFEYANSLIEYPQTDPDGYTYVVYTGNQSQAEIKEMFHSVKYQLLSTYQLI